ncbi:MAG: hypothetical protein ACRD3N_01590 [Terracidiphilus sp.]
MDPRRRYEENKTKVEAQRRYLLYGWMLLALLFATACIKHLIRVHLWNTLIFAGIEDVTIVVLIVYLQRYRCPDRDEQVRLLAGFAMYCILMVGIIAEIGMGVLNR